MRKLLTLRGIGQKLCVSERTAHALTNEEWFPPAIVLGERLHRWDETEIDSALATRAPRKTESKEPAQLVAARKRITGSTGSAT